MTPLIERMVSEWVLGSYSRELAYMRDSIRVLKETLRNEIWRLLTESGQFNPPFKPALIRKFRDYSVTFVEDNELGVEGFIRGVKGGFEIRYRTFDELGRKIPRVRIRFTLAHELSHIFSFDLRSDPPTPLGVSKSWREEGFFNELAREFLIPSRFVRDRLDQNDRLIKTPSVINFISLKGEFDVSSDVLAYRFVKDLSVWDVIFIKGLLLNDFTFDIRLILKGKSFKGAKTLNILDMFFSKHNINDLTNNIVKDIIKFNKKKYIIESFFYNDRYFIAIIR